MNNTQTTNIKQLQQEITNIKKILLDYKFKQATRQTIKSHEIRKYKKELVKMMTIAHQQTSNYKN